MKKANCSLYETFSSDVGCVRYARDFYFSYDLYQIASPDDGYSDFTAVYGRDGKKTVRFRLPQPRHGRLQAQARQRVQDLQESLKKRLSKSISVGGCSSTNSPKRLD